MTEEPYRWLEAIANRREYVREQLKDGTPVFAACLPEGVLLLGVGTGHSKVFEVFDRHALAGLGHPADLEKVRQAAIDAAHTEAFTRAPEDVSLRRLVGFGLGPVLKQNFEQIFSAPSLVELLFAEVGPQPGQDLLARLHFDGTFRFHPSGAMVAASTPETEAAAQEWIDRILADRPDRAAAAEALLQTWWCLVEKKPLGADAPPEARRREGWRAAVRGRVVELGWLARVPGRRSRFEPLTPADLGL